MSRSAAFWGNRMVAYLDAMRGAATPAEADFYAASARLCAIYAGTAARLNEAGTA